MAANKFATMVHRKTNSKITLVLVYALLEWILILLLLLNSLFSFLIIKFADYFGLKRPCLFCSRLDHIFDPSNKTSYRDFLCDDHASEISRLSFCSSHRKLVESRDMLCEDCSSSRDVVGKSMTDSDTRCSCCRVSIDSKVLPPCIMIKHGWEILDFTENGNSNPSCYQVPSDTVHEQDEGEHNGKEGTEDPSEDENRDMQIVPEVSGEEADDDDDDEFSCFISSFDCNKEATDANNEVTDAKNEVKDANKEDDLVEVASKEDDDVQDKASEEVVTKHLEFYIDREDCHLIPVEFYKLEEEDEDQRGMCDGGGDVILDFDVRVGTQADFVVEHRHLEEEETVAFVSSTSDELKLENESGGMLESVESHTNKDQAAASDDSLEVQNDEADAEVSIGTEIPEHEHIDEDGQELSAHLSENADDEHGFNQVEEDMIEFKTVTIEIKKPVIHTGIQFSSELHEMEEERLPETPNSVDSSHQLHRRLLLDRKESGTEDSLDSLSITSEIECPDGVLTIEKLKSALREERKALNALYAELEEERSASAVAANQTMAMINRLQEEKAAMQMEALQFQRMMEEQSEYDLEALQLLNEIVVKREKEKAEVEKELEVFKKKVEEYEAKEKIAMLRRRHSSGGSCTNTEDTDGLSVDLSQETKEDKDSCYDDRDGIIEHKHTPVDAVLCLEESLADFEEERLSILEQLKALEEKLFTLNDEGGEEHFEDVKPMENGNGNGHIGENGTTENGHFHSKEINGKQHKLLKSKRLLPLFDAADRETENGLSNGNHYENGTDHSASPKNSSVGEFEVESKGIALEEEVDVLYERLQALEADREFLRHCIGSLNKGDKGVYLLQEILQHLRDLRSVELRVRSMGDSAL